MRKGDPKDKDAVQAAVRQVAREYLRDANINSVGVGYATKDGKRTRRLALQFTVGRKLAPEQLEAARTRPIPPRITANGIEFDTDVVERSFEHHPTAVEVETKAERKRRLDPMMPGISVGHVESTAGTLGCLVREVATGETRMLSNWHVLHGDPATWATRSSSPAPTTTTGSRRTSAAGSCAASSDSPATAR
jgi:endonuclease G, mitochondrial